MARSCAASHAVQITLGSGGSGHDGVGCTTEGVSTPDRAGIPLNGARLRTAGDGLRRQLLWIASAAAFLAFGVVVILVVPMMQGEEGT